MYKLKKKLYMSNANEDQNIADPEFYVEFIQKLI